MKVTNYEPYRNKAGGVFTFSDGKQASGMFHEGVLSTKSRFILSFHCPDPEPYYEAVQNLYSSFYIALVDNTTGLERHYRFNFPTERQTRELKSGCMTEWRTMTDLEGEEFYSGRWDAFIPRPIECVNASYEDCQLFVKAGGLML